MEKLIGDLLVLAVPVAAALAFAGWLFQRGREAAKNHPVESAIAKDAEIMKPLLATCRDCGASIEKRDVSLREQSDLVKKFESEHPGHWVKVSYKL